LFLPAEHNNTGRKYNSPPLFCDESEGQAGHWKANVSKETRNSPYSLENLNFVVKNHFAMMNVAFNGREDIAKYNISGIDK